jgi:isoleucyl-tRNA synthetase
MRRVSEVIDCWFDSGCMPFAQWGWPHQNHAKFDAAFPADFISEAIDQTRGWFYSLLMISTMLFDDETCKKHCLAPRGLPRPFKNCLVLGHVCDMDGKKESKSKGNYTSPNLVLRGVTKLAAVADPGLARGTIGLKKDQVASLELGEDRVILTGSAAEPVHAKVVPAKVGPKDTCHLHPEDLAALGLADGAQVSFRVPYEPPGADAFRWLFCASSPPWSNTRLSLRAIREGQRDFLIRLRNVYQFFAIYAEIGADNGSFDPKRAAPRAVGDRHLLDRWITGPLHATIATVTRELDAVRLYEASRALSAFVDDLSNWYVRRSRERFWGEGVDLEDSLWTLWEVLVGLSKVLAPFVPFTAEALYRALVVAPGVAGPESVHLCAWPEAGSHDPALAADMALIRDLASLGLSARAASKLKVRQPLHDATVILADPSRRTAVDALAGLLTDELNVHRIVFAEDAGTYVDFAAKPDFKKLGARLGKDMKAVAAKVAAIPGVEVSRALAAGGLEVTLEDGRNFSISADEVLVTVTPKAGFQAASSAAAVVAVKTELDEALRAEGFVRELVNRVQTMRKEADLGYTQRIELDIDADRDVLGWVETHAAYLKHETLATAARLGQGRGNKAVDVEGRAVRVRMTPK